MANIWSDSLSRSILTDDVVDLSAEVRTAKWFEAAQRSAAPTAHTNYGQFYVKASDGKPYFKTSGGTELNLGMTGADPLLFKGTIAIPANFPTVAAVQSGWVYRVTADVIDNDATKTNTGLAFVAGSEIAWTGSTWCDLGVTETYTLVNATPYAVADAARCIGVDTVTIGAPSAINLPTAAGRTGKQIKVVDATGEAMDHNVSVNPNGAETINGVAAPFVLTLSRQIVVLVSDGTGWHTLGNETILMTCVRDADFAGAGLGRMVRTGAATYAIRQDNLAAAVDPIATDDTAAGYGIDSLWINTTAVPPRVFQCTNPGAGVAVWRPINRRNNYTAVIPPVVGDDDTLGYDVGSVWIDTATDLIYICAHNATGAAVWRLSLNVVAAGGELAGNYPNPTVADGVIDAANGVAGAVAGLVVDKGTPSSCVIAFDNAGAAQRPADGASYTFSIGGVPFAAIEARDAVIDQYDFLRSSAGAEEADTILMAAAFAAAINANTVIGPSIRAAIYGGAGDGRWYVQCYTRLQADITAGLALTCVLAGGQPGVYQARATGIAASKRQLFPLRYAVTAQDVLAGEIRFDFGGTAVVAYGLDILTAAADYTRIAWNGAVALAGGQLTIDNGGGTDWAAGNIITGWMLCSVA